MGRIVMFRAHGEGLERLPIDADTLDEATLKTGHGVYTVFRIYHGGRVLRFDRHLERMRRSASLLGQGYQVSDEWLRGVVRRAWAESGIEAPRVRLTVPFDTPDSALIALEPFTPPAPELYKQGVRVGLINARRDAPLAKNTQFIEQRKQIESAHGGQFYEILLCNENETILEGVGSNFYAVLNGELRTAVEGVLHGISRSKLLELAPHVLPVNLTPVTCNDLPQLSEAMMTSASRGVIPIVQVGDVVIGTGKPGVVFTALRHGYDESVEAELEDL